MNELEIVIDDPNAGHKIMALAGGAVFNPLGETCIARYKAGRLLGGVVYSNYAHRSLEVHVAGLAPRWLNRELLWIAFDYPFVQLGCEKIFARIQASNTPAVEFNANLGFTREAVLKDVYPDGDLYIMSMYRESCRHLVIRPRGNLKRNQRP